MYILRKQDGRIKIIWILLLGLIIFASLPAYRIISIHLHANRIISVMKNLKSDSYFQLYAISADNIKAELLNRFELEKVPEITADEITVTPSADRFDVRVKHHYEEKIILKKYFILDIDESTYIPIRKSDR